MYYDINLRSNWSEPSKVDSLPSLSPKLPTWLKWSYSPGWWWLGCPPTQWWLPDQAVEACHQAQDRLSLAEERPNTIGSSLAAREKHSDKHTSLSLLPFFCNIQYESQVCLTETILTHAAPWQIPKYPLYLLTPPFVNVGFRASICSSVYLKKGHFNYCFPFQLLWDKKGKKIPVTHLESCLQWEPLSQVSWVHCLGPCKF